MKYSFSESAGTSVRGSVGCSRLTNTEHVLPNLIEVVDLCLLRGVYDDDHGAQGGEEAAQLAVEVEVLLQQLGGQHRTAGGGVSMSVHVAQGQSNTVECVSLARETSTKSELMSDIILLISQLL